MNVLIGENDTGKTAILDALRLSLGIGPQRETYLDTDLDYFRNVDGTSMREVRFDLTFAGLSEEDRWVFVEMLSLDADGTSPTLQLHVKYWLENVRGVDRQRFRFWGGADESEEQSVPQEVMELFFYVHMEALRDAKRFLRPARGNRLGQLLAKLEPDREKQQGLARGLSDAISHREDWNALLRNAEATMNVHLLRTALRDTAPLARLSFVPQEFRQIAEGLKLLCHLAEPVSKEVATGALKKGERVADYFEEAGQGRYRLKEDAFLSAVDPSAQGRLCELVQYVFPFVMEVGQAGLGTANLLYAATVLGDLEKYRKANEDAYIALMIEEPEAHLHPQLQRNLFSYFEEVEQQGIQVFVTSHSPTITAKTPLNAVAALQRGSNRAIGSVHLRSFGLPNKSLRLLQRFLDVTKSQLFFARGAIFVEGVSESLVLPLLARRMGDEFDLGRKGVEIVNIGGVAFEHFARLFNSEDRQKRLRMRAAIMTDGDPKNGERSPRARNAEKLQGGHLRVCVTPITFEHDLYCLNEQMVNGLLRRHDKDRLVPSGDTVEDRANTFVSTLKKQKEFTKARFAQELAGALEEDPALLVGLRVPSYIEKAVRWVVKGEYTESTDTGTAEGH